jgi:phosphate/sulfate permease
MDKEKILEQSRKSGMDEREREIEKLAGFYGLFAVILLAVILEIFKIIKGLPYSDMMAIICAQTAGISYYKHKKLPERKGYLVAAIFATVATVAAVVAFFLDK